MGSLLFFLVVLALVYRVYITLRARNTKKVKKCPSECRLAVFLGSGGHTSEALTLVSSLDFAYYKKRIYIVSEGDNLSAEKASRLEAYKSSSPREYLTITIPRARRVHQPLYTAPFSAAISMLSCVYYMCLVPILGSKEPSISADVLLMNGPGTCLSLCLAAHLNRFIGRSSPTLIYVESFARVSRLSLSGKILRYFVDRFLVQWPQLSNTMQHHHGWLV